jgi:endonuclease YncB( thermonuclease family)
VFLVTKRIYIMSINLETVLALLLLTIVGGIPAAAGQNALSTSTTVASNIIDLVDNVTESGGGEEETESPLPLEALEDQSSSPFVDNVTESGGGGGGEEEEETESPLPLEALEDQSSSPFVDNVTESGGGGGGEEEEETESPLPLEALEDQSSSTSVNGDDDTSSVTAGDSTLINEVELNPSGNDMEEREWIELYNPTSVDINISGFEITPSFQSPTIKLPPDAVIEAGETYVIKLDRPILSNTGESLVLANATGDIQDRTPSLVDRSDDDHTWQRIPDGNNEWQFVQNTEGNPNDDDSDTRSTTLDSEEDTPSNPNDDPDTLSTILDSVYSGSDVECLGSAGCIEGVATRIVDGDTLYVRANGTVYKVDLALTEAPSRNEEMFAESTAFTRDLCLGSTVLVDQDDMLPTSNSGVTGVVYCSSSNLNSELLDNGYAELKTEQCATSEFANEPWVKDHGC